MKKDATGFAKMDSFIIVATFFSLWFAVFFKEGVENFLAYVLILTFGILHGANDLKLIESSSTISRNRKGYFKILFYYVVFVGASVVLFYVVPSAALLLFIIFSGYHFGEQHWIAKTRSKRVLAGIFHLFYGLVILFLLLSAHISEVTSIIYEICGYMLPNYFYGYALSFSSIVSICLGIYLFSTKALRSSIFKELFFILVFFIVFNTATLLWAFAIYFILWHALPSLVDQITYLYGNLEIVSVKKYIRTSFPYWLISVLGISFFLLIFRNNLYDSLAFFFSFLAAITFPHVLVINRLNRN